MLRPAPLATLLILSLFGAAAPAGDPLELDSVPGTVREALTARRFPEALRAVEELAAQRPEAADLWCWLRGLALVHGGQDGPGAAELERFETEFVTSPWRSKATFLRAEALRAAGRHGEAEAIYERAVAELRSEPRQRELAAVYLDFADSLSIPADPPDPGQALDHARAEVLYGRTLDLDLPADLVERAMYRRAVCKQRLSDWGGAVQLYRTFLEQHDDGGTGPLGIGRVAEALRSLGDCQKSAGDRRGARRTYEDLARRLRAGEQRGGAESEQLRELAGEAAYRAAGTWLEESGEDRLLGVGALERLLERDPGHRRAQRARFDIGEAQRSLGRHEEALAAFARVIEAGASSEAPDAEAREENARLVQRALFLRGEILFGQGRLDEAIGAFTTYTRTHTSGADWSAAQRQILEAEFARGERLKARGAWGEARETWRRFLEQHPLDSRAAELAFAIGELYVHEAEERRDGGLEPDSQTLGLYHEAIREWRRLVSKNPGSDPASRALYRIGHLQESRLDQLEEAIGTYTSCDFGSHAGEARSRLWQMTQETLAVRTPRTWRSDEAASVTAELRNVESLQVSIYPLDLEAYFRKHLTHRSIEELDLDLIAPARSYTFEVPDYERYAAVERSIELPVEGPGVWAVALATQSMRATTLVIRSDVEVIVKSSRQEVFVFAEDVLQGRPAAGVDVLVALPPVEAGAPPVFREMSTSRDGVARLAFEELERGAALRVFAARDGHCASNGLDLSGIGRTTSAGPRSLVYTSRPAYRPGDEVHWRAILREWEDGRSTFERGAPVSYELRDAQGLVIDAGRGELGEFGTLHGRARLDAFAPTGSYRVLVRDAEGRESSAGFQVERYRLDPIELFFEFDQDVVFRGETVQASVTARYYYGEPVVDSPVSYELPDGRRGELRTDDEGRVRIELETRDFTREGPLTLRATLTQERVSASAAVYLALRGFRARLDLDRELFLAGDRFQVDVATTLPNGDPTGRELELRVARLESEDGRVSDVHVSTHPVKTDAESGEATLALRLDRGGTYLLRLEGQDRFGNPVVAERRIEVSGDDDTTRLRILSDAQTARVGEVLTVDVHNRAEPGLALLTIEGESVLEYRLMDLVRGSNPVQLPVADDHDPNFVVAAAMMRGTEFHQARADFVVERGLSIEVLSATETWVPGEETELELRVTDALGRPVRAELSLAVVDEALFEAFPDRIARLMDVFRPVRREWAALETATSCGFSYTGTTGEIAEEVLAEARQAFAAVEWRGRRAQALEQLDRADKGLADLRLGLEMVPEATPLFGADSFNDPIGTGGGSGGRFGGRFGGRARRAETGEDDSSGLDADLAHWAPAVVTDDEGRATVSFRVPERSTRWRVTCRGTDRTSSVGETRASFRSRADLFLELLAPLSLTEGDSLRPRIRLHDARGEQGRATLELNWSMNGRVHTLGAVLELDGRPQVEHVFAPLPAAELGPPTVLSTVARVVTGAGTREVRERIELPVRPFGVPVSDHQSGLLRDETAFTLQLGPDAESVGRELELYLGPDPARALVEAALARRRPTQLRCGTLHGDAAGELAGVCAVLRAITARNAHAPQGRDLRERARGLVARLVSTQTEDGGWRWGGRRGGSHLETSCTAVDALQAARALGLSVPRQSLERARAYLSRAFTALALGEDERKAMILFAQSAGDAADFSAVNRLHRQRQSLSPAALAYTVRTLVRMERPSMAAEVAAVLAERAREGGDRPRWEVDTNLHWNRSDLAMRALALVALFESRSEADWLAGAAEELWASAPWTPLRARGLVLEALAAQGAWSREADAFRVRLTVDGQEREVFSFDGDAPGRRWSLALPADAAPGVRVGLRLEGRGTPHFSAELRGITRRFERHATPEMRLDEQGYLRSAPTHAGHTIPTGFDLTQGLRREERWKNGVTELARGGTLRGYARFSYDSALPPTEDPGDYLVLEVPLPAGTRLLEGSVTGRFLSHEEHEDRLVVQIGQLRGGGELSYTLIASDVGSWRAAPAVLRSAYEPDRFAIGTPRHLEVLESGTPVSDDYRPTPDELFHLGRALYREAAHDAARDRLGRLYEEFAAHLRETPLRETAEMMLFLSIRAAHSGDVVRYFEVLREKNPDLVVPIEDVLAVGRAYRELGEYERALLIFKAALEESFGKDLKVAGTLEEQGDLAGSFDTLERLWLDYPDSPAVRATYLALCDKRLTRAPSAHEDDGLRAAGRDRAFLSLQGILGLQRYLAFYPGDPRAADAALNLVSAHLELEDYERVSALSSQMAAVFEDPAYRDAFEYSRAVAQWYLGQDAGAQELLERISEATYVDEAGVLRPSRNRDLALYILGQIFHARREYGPASVYYERVRDQFTDARQVLEEFREKRIELPEVTTTPIGAATTLELSHANVGAVEVLAYEVDLMTLYLREKNLSAVTQVNLAGISPTVRVERELPDGEGPEDLKTELQLALEEPGAYLVICRGADLFASGLVLVTDIELGVREDATSGRLRVTATDRGDGRFLSDLDVRVVGSQSGRVLRGQTDRRGLYIADGLGGVATVIARGDTGEYAFYRGRESLGAPPQQEAGRALQDLQSGPTVGEYFKNVRDLNDLNIQSRNEQLEKAIQQARKGVQVKAVR